MNTRYDTEHDLRDLHETGEHDREISLSTTTILGIFFALALLCAVFFGFGLFRHGAEHGLGHIDLLDLDRDDFDAKGRGVAVDDGLDSQIQSNQRIV